MSTYKRPIDLSNPSRKSTGTVHNDVPPHLKDKVAELAIHRASVERLSKLLRIAQKKRDQLEEELADYLGAVAPIQACPPEVLSHAFRFYLQENPRLLRRLMLVCRKWYNTVINDPTLWTQILVHVNPENCDMLEQARSHASYITACIRRSGSCLLDIDISLEELVTTTSHGGRRIYKSMLELFDGDDSNQFVEDWISDLDFSDFDAMGKDTVSDPQHIINLVELLVGNRCAHMTRWRYLCLSLPTSNDELAFEIWKMFKGETPNLEVLHIHGAGSGYDQYVKRFRRGFPNMSAIQTLEVGAVADLKFLTRLKPITVKRLVITTDLGKSRSYDLNRFENITSLVVIRPVNDLPWEMESFDPTTNLNLPHLTTLNLAGYFTDIDLVNFDLPALETLLLMPSITDPTYIGHKLPNVDPSTIYWSFKYNETTDSILFQTLLTRVLTRYKRAETLYIDDSAYEALHFILRDLHRRGEWPESWKRIQVGDDEVWFTRDNPCWSD